MKSWLQSVWVQEITILFALSRVVNYLNRPTSQRTPNPGFVTFLIQKSWVFTFFQSYQQYERLECSGHAKNISNRKDTFFYIEAIPKNIFQLRKVIFLRAEPKTFLKLWVG